MADKQKGKHGLQQRLAKEETKKAMENANETKGIILCSAAGFKKDRPATSAVQTVHPSFIQNVNSMFKL